MNDFEYIDKAISIVYMQTDLSAILSLLTQLQNGKGQATYEAFQGNLHKFMDALKKLEGVSIGSGTAAISLSELIAQIENGSQRALDLLQAHAQSIVSQINTKAAMKQKDTTIKGLSIVLHAYKLVQSFYSASVRAQLATILYELGCKEADGYIIALEHLKDAENAPNYLYSLLIPDSVIEENNDREESFWIAVEKDYAQAKMQTHIPRSLRKKRYESTYYYELLFYVLEYFKIWENYKDVYNKIAMQAQDNESYYIICQDTYKHFPQQLKGSIIEKLRSLLVGAQDTKEKTNKYFKALEALKKQATSLKDLKRKKLNVGLKQSIILMKLSLCVAIIHELSKRLKQLDLPISEDIRVPRETAVNTSKLPRFPQWLDSFNDFISSLENQEDTFQCLVYHKLLSAVFDKYDALSKLYDNIYQDTMYDNKDIRAIVEDKSKMIATIQTNPQALLRDVCHAHQLEADDQVIVSKIFQSSNAQIIPITENCLEEFCYALPGARKQYEIALRHTNKHPLYPLITIYTEWYKLRSFILFFENLGNTISSYCIGYEEQNGLAFEMFYKDLVYINYLFGQQYHLLDQATPLYTMI
ncbi:hypothetical protein, partial [Facilibium subflavum]|uniref:hypothetical protein n=1 Tax=Facilibium subflavum TaxID=2219058 RepID=UPI0013C309EA